jgi:hypothetical protein
MFKFFYASSDTGSDYIINRLIRVADKISNQYIDAIINIGTHHTEQTLSDKKARLYSVFSETSNCQRITKHDEIIVSVVIRPMQEIKSL